METLKNYLKTMFMDLPDTAEVQKAKKELYQMMEDKYNELIKDGKAEHEAIAIVISEFGNLEELSEELGIHTTNCTEAKNETAADRVDQEYCAQTEWKKEENNAEKSASKIVMAEEDVKAYQRDYTKSKWLIAIGAMLCIISSAPIVVLGAIGEYAGEAAENFMENIGVCALLLIVAVAVILFIISGGCMSKWKRVKKGYCTLNRTTYERIEKQYEKDRGSGIVLVAIGVALCICAVIPTIVADELLGGMIEELAVGAMLSTIAAGTLIIILGAMGMEKNKALLKLGFTEDQPGQGPVYYSEREDFGSEEEIVYKDPTVNAIMSVYWQSITCLYLIVSFLTFDWHKTWLIWPVAAVIHALLKNLFAHKKDRS